MNNFRSLKRETIVDGQEVLLPIEENNRELQGIKGRKVSLYYDFDDLNILGLPPLNLNLDLNLNLGLGL